MQENQLVSIIIPIYNAKEYLHSCIESVLGQDYANYEIILVDDGSTDGSSEICDFYGLNSKIRIIHQKNSGVSTARNKGLEVVRGDYIAFLDADDYIEKNYISSLMESIIFNKTQIAFCDFVIVKSDNSLMILKQHADREHIIWCKNKLNFSINHFTSNVCGKLISKELIKENRFDTDICIGEDSVFIAKCLKEAKSISYSNETFYYYRMNSNSVMHEEYSKKKLDELEAWRRIQEIYKNEKYTYNSCRLRYLKVCKRIGTMLQKTEKDQRGDWKKYCREIRKNIRYVIFGEDFIREKIKLLLFSFAPWIHYALFRVKNTGNKI